MSARFSCKIFHNYSFSFVRSFRFFVYDGSSATVVVIIITYFCAHRFVPVVRTIGDFTRSGARYYLYMYSYTGGLTGAYAEAPSGPPTYLPSSETASQHQQLLVSPLVPNTTTPNASRPYSSSNLATLGASLSPNFKRRRYCTRPFSYNRLTIKLFGVESAGAARMNENLRLRGSN